MKSKSNYYWSLAVLPIVFIVWFFVSKNADKPIRYLAYFGPKNALKINDTTYHSVPDFEFVDQDNEKVTQKTVENKIYVTEYFFTTCQSICPVMNTHLEQIYKEFKDEADFLILSHTVDPETDSVPVLKDYASLHNVKDKRWLFVTGKKTELYDLARKGYILNAEEGDGGEEDFIHTQNFALVDKERHIRGYYDGTDSVDMNRMRTEIKLLLNEYRYKNSHL